MRRFISKNFRYINVALLGTLVVNSCYSTYRSPKAPASQPVEYRSLEREPEEIKRETPRKKEFYYESPRDNIDEERLNSAKDRLSWI